METNWCILDVDENGMWAKMALKLPTEEDSIPITTARIEKFIKDQGITSGVNSAAINTLALEKKYGQFVEIAHGKEPVNGVDGHYEFLIEVEDAKAKPILNEDGSVDYLNSLKLAEVHMDEHFARYVYATRGEYGHDIFSRIVPPVLGKDIPPLRGSGFYSDANKENYYSKYTGHISRKDNVITIDKTYIIKGDLDIDTGNINFDADVEVFGDVRSGLSIQAGGSIYIHGHVGACFIQATDNIIIQKGIQGQNRCNVIAGNDITCSYVERCAISAGNNVYADSILDSIVTARNEVIVSSKIGAIIGGTTIGMVGITAKEIGNDAEVNTFLQTGPSKEDLVRSTFLTEQLYKIKAEYDLLDAKVKRYDEGMTPENESYVSELRQKVFRMKVMVAADKNKTSDELNKLNDQINRARRDAHIRVTGTSFPGVKISIENNIYITTEALKDVVYKLRYGKVEALSGDNVI